jgi:hypothetical protein
MGVRELPDGHGPHPAGRQRHGRRLRRCRTMEPLLRTRRLGLTTATIGTGRWIAAGNVRRVTDSEWDVEEYRRCREKLRAIQRSNRLPGFFPV